MLSFILNFVKDRWSFIVIFGICFLFSCSKHPNTDVVPVTQPPEISILAGSGQKVSAGQDGLGTNASFYLPTYLAVDNSGNVIVYDSGDRKIRKVTPTGTVTTIATISNDINFNSGYFYGLATDKSGNIYLSGQVSIYKIAGDGTVSIFVGSSSQRGFADGPSGSALLNSPGALAFDNTRDLYFADANNNGVSVIREISKSGVVTTVIGSSTQMPSDPARLRDVKDIDFDTSGNMYFINNNSLEKFTSGGDLSTIEDYYSLGTSINPALISIDANGDIFLMDLFYNELHEITASGTDTRILGARKVSATAPVVDFNQPGGMAFDLTGKILYIADTQNNVIRKIVFN